MNENIDKFIEGIFAAIEGMEEAKFMTHEQKAMYLTRIEARIKDELARESKEPRRDGNLPPLP